MSSTDPEACQVAHGIPRITWHAPRGMRRSQGYACCGPAAGANQTRTAVPRAAIRASFTRAVLSSSTLRRRTTSGVTSTHSSSRRNSSAWSSDSWRCGHQPDELVGGRGAHVRQLLLLGGVDVEVLGAGVLADDHALVDLVAGPHEQRPALLEVEQRERGHRAPAVGDQRAAGAGAQLAVPRLPARRTRGAAGRCRGSR